MIQDGATRLQRLVDDLLDLSRIENGRYRIERQPLDLGGLLERSVREARQSTERHTLALRLPSNLPSIEADADRVSQVVTNLITNAVRYSPDGGEIRVAAEARPDAVVVSVSDQGIGIPADRLGQVFEKFYRVDNRVTRTVSGTGLGLAISRELVQAHGGDIWVESTPGRGSTFSFSLPFSPANALPATARVEPGSGEAAA
jgi:signal transduction histidine kinase